MNYQDVLGGESRTWKDSSLYDSFILYQKENRIEYSFVMQRERNTSCTYKHPLKIRNAGDKAKLISTNVKVDFLIVEDLIQKSRHYL